eukprot:140288-Pelagomonas_calceolata.AAC.6
MCVMQAHADALFARKLGRGAAELTLRWGQLMPGPKAGLLWAPLEAGWWSGGCNGSSRASWADHGPPCASAWYSPCRKEFSAR